MLMNTLFFSGKIKLLRFFSTALILIFLFSSSKKNEAPPGMVFIHGHKFVMGSNHGLDNEAPLHTMKVHDFFIDKNLVTVQQFADFVKATGYKTDAEKFGDGAIFNFETMEWMLLDSADWQHPLGQRFSHAPADHPVTQVSWQDAQAYCAWAHKRLPTEAEWEFAARQGINSTDKYSWGNKLFSNEKFHANVWQGSFPENNTVADGFFFTSPVGYFGAAPNGLSDMGGNVWEICADNYKLYEEKTAQSDSIKVLRGGSFLCDSMVCHGYRVSARMYTTLETATFHVGFRCAMDAKK